MSPLVLLSAALSAVPVSIVAQPGEDDCVSAKLFADALVRHGHAETDVVQSAHADDHPDRFRAWLTRDESGLELHAAGPGAPAWARRFPNADCAAQRDAAAIALLSLLDPLPLLPLAPPPVTAPPPQAPPPDDVASLASWGVSAVIAYRWESSHQLAPGAGVDVTLPPSGHLHLRALAWNPSSLSQVPGGVEEKTIEAGALWSWSGAREGWSVDPRAGLVVTGIEPVSPGLASETSGAYLNPGARVELVVRRCTTRWCAAALAGATVWFRQEDLLFNDQAPFTSTALFAADVALEVSWGAD